jgi:hypothetical protein
MYRRRMRTCQHIAFTLFDTYDILYGGHKSDDAVGSGRWRRFLDLCEFRFSKTVWNVFVTELRDSVVFSVAHIVLSTFDVYWAYGSAHTFSHPTHHSMDWDSINHGLMTIAQHHYIQVDRLNCSCFRIYKRGSKSYCSNSGVLTYACKMWIFFFQSYLYT